MDETKTSAHGVTGEHAPDRRRSIRLHIAMPVMVRGMIETRSFQEETHTMTVSAHGCMVRLNAQLVRDQEVSIVNPKTAEELPCKVISIGQRDAGKREIGLEFNEPSPLFWRIAFPPEDWDPAERKLPSPAQPSPKTRR
jgi:hypothetical protein